MVERWVGVGGLSLVVGLVAACSDGPVVTVRTVVTHVVGDHEVEVPTQVGGSTVELLIVGAAGEVSRVPGVEVEPGRVVFEDVPPGTTRFVRWDQEYEALEGDVLDRGSVTLGRPDRRVAADSTQVRFDVRGLAPSDQRQLFELFVPQLGLYSFTLPTLPAAGGATPGAVEWRSRVGPKPYLIDAAAGDVLTVAQLVEEQVGAARILTLARTATWTDATLVDGATTVLSGDATAPATSEMITFDVRGPTFASALRFRPDQVRLDFGALPRADRHGVYHPFPDLAIASVDADPDRSVGPFALRDPHPADWTRFVEVTAISESFLLGSEGISLSAGFTDALEAVRGQPLALRLSAVRNLTIDGRDPGATEWPSAGIAPVLRWNAPETGTADLYVLEAHRRDANEPVTTFRTRETELAIPSGVLASGGSYVFILRAESGTDPTKSRVRALRAAWVEKEIGPVLLRP